MINANQDEANWMRCRKACGNKFCQPDYFCAKCCHAAAQGDPTRELCVLKKHRLPGAVVQHNVAPAPNTNATPSAVPVTPEPLFRAPPPSNAIASSSNSRSHTFSNPLPTRWAREYNKAALLADDQKSCTQELHNNLMTLKQSYNLIWFNKSSKLPLIITICLHTTYMSIESIQTESFNLMNILGLEKSSVFWVYVKGEWCLHQADTSWQMVPEQHLLYRTFDVQADDCVGLDDELKFQPGAPASAGGPAPHISKHKCEEIVSPPLKRPYVSISKPTTCQSSRKNTPAPSASHKCATVACVSPVPSESPSSHCSSPSPPPPNLSAIISTTSKASSRSLSSIPSSIAAPSSKAAPRSKSADSLKPTPSPHAPKTKPVPAEDQPIAIWCWPNDFSLSEVVDSLDSMKERMNKGVRQNNAFMKTFGVKCVRETLQQKCAVLDLAKSKHWEVYNKFLDRGDSEGAHWVFFEAQVTGRLRGKDAQEMEEAGDDSEDKDADENQNIQHTREVSPANAEESEVEADKVDLGANADNNRAFSFPYLL
ncbi:hypothetical protein K439DRAFT_1624356 [Ramaria rubella]|nr:hypothetical protein K439DRAFT_1624356 [Ramaria rubella]